MSCRYKKWASVVKVIGTILRHELLGNEVKWNILIENTASNRSWLRPGQPKCFHWSVQTTCTTDCSWILMEQNLHSLFCWKQPLKCWSSRCIQFDHLIAPGILAFSANGYANRKHRKELPCIKAYRPRHENQSFFFFPESPVPVCHKAFPSSSGRPQNTLKTSSMFAAHETLKFYV